MTSPSLPAPSRPTPFSAYTTPEFWNDPHISARLLTAHLDPETDNASRSHAFIERSAAWMVGVLELDSATRLLDLGCGPGLYARQCAQRGINVLGVDVSERALAYVLEVATRDNLPIQVRHGNYLDIDLDSQHDAAILIYEDYCALSPAQRAHLLGRIHQALRPGGHLLFDVTAVARFAQIHDAIVHQQNLMDGFWAEHPYQGTHETWTYPDDHLILDRYTIRTGAWTRQFWNWMHCLAPGTVGAELHKAGFGIQNVYGDVAGASFDVTAVTFAVHAQRR